MNTEKEIFIPNQKARKLLAEKLNLNFEEYMQDWEYEISDLSRIGEFIAEYDKKSSTIAEKQILMEIILDSLNDLKKLNANTEFNDQLEIVNSKLQQNPEIHKGTINYWKTGEFKISGHLKI